MQNQYFLQFQSITSTRDFARHEKYKTQRYSINFVFKTVFVDGIIQTAI